MNARDELDEIHRQLVAGARQEPPYVINRETAIYAYSEGAEHALDTVRLLGYRKPRIITTIEEVDALPDRAVVITYYGDAVTIYRDNPGLPPEHYHFLVQGIPATVLYEPEA